METATIVQINVSRGGVPKLPVPFAEVDKNGVQGDAQADLRYHGGPDRAVCLLAVELIQAWSDEGHPIAPGSSGENITTRGLAWNRVVPGAKLRLGAALIIEITDYATPCRKQSRWFSDGGFGRLSQKLHPGSSRVYARVRSPGRIEPGDAITWVEKGVRR